MTEQQFSSSSSELVVENLPLDANHPIVSQIMDIVGEAWKKCSRLAATQPELNIKVNQSFKKK